MHEHAMCLQVGSGVTEGEGDPVINLLVKYIDPHESGLELPIA